MKKLLLVLLFAPLVSFGQNYISDTPPRNYSNIPFGTITKGQERSEILTIIDQFMLAVNTKDKAIFDKILYKGIQKIVTRIDGESRKNTVYDNDSLIQNIAQRNDEYQERYWDVQVITEGNIASVWAPYDFYKNNSFSHCGVDLFYLVKEEKKWKIAHFGYTVNTLCK